MQPPNLTVSQTQSACEALATGAARNDAGDSAGDDGADRSDRGCHVTFRSDWGILGVGNYREGDVPRRERRRLVLRGEIASRSEIRNPYAAMHSVA